ncbi:hypothetical protein [Oerskovia turbata]
MSSDDLTWRAREWASALPEHIGEPVPTLLTELADEVDRLRAREVLHTEAAETSRRIEEGQLQRIIAVEDERDAARAALGRVRDVLDDNRARVGMNPGVRLPMLTGEIRRALEGESRPASSR